MPKLSDEKQEERRAHILDAAERCFTRAGFRGASMQEICREAGVSPGALYVWFKSKEDLIAGIAARNRDEVLESFALFADAEDFMAGMAAVLASCVLNQPREKSVLCLEIGAEATRNPAVAATLARFDEVVDGSLRDLLAAAQAKGMIRPRLPLEDMISAMVVIADGLFWRRAVDPDFDGEATGRALLAMVSEALGARPADASGGGATAEPSILESER